MSDKKPAYASVANKMAEMGRSGDDTLVHINKQELEGLGAVMGIPLGTNPETGLPEAFPWVPLIAALALGGISAAAAPPDKRLQYGLAGGLAGLTGGAMLAPAAATVPAVTAAVAPAVAPSLIAQAAVPVIQGGLTTGHAGSLIAAQQAAQAAAAAPIVSALAGSSISPTAGMLASTGNPSILGQALSSTVPRAELAASLLDLSQLPNAAPSVAEGGIGSAFGSGISTVKEALSPAFSTVKEALSPAFSATKKGLLPLSEGFESLVGKLGENPMVGLGLAGSLAMMPSSEEEEERDPGDTSYGEEGGTGFSDEYTERYLSGNLKSNEDFDIEKYIGRDQRRRRAP